MNTQFNVTNIVEVQVGGQVPYLGTPHSIPGEIEAGFYDKFEGGIGQNIAYVDTSIGNNGDFRTEENIDAISVNGEGATVGWNAAGEWMEYSVDVQTAGIYDLSFRYASGNESGGGPFYFEVDGSKVSSDISVTYTSDWDVWQTHNVSNIELTKGENVLRLFIENGEFNIGKMTFSYKEALPYIPPIAEAGANVSVILPNSTAILDGSGSNDPEGQTITYNWEQIYGPSVIIFDNKKIASPNISNLVEGVYKCRLTVYDGTYQDSDDVLVIVSANGNVNPTISITSPSNNAAFKEGEKITISASASDLDGTIALVEFYNDDEKLGEDSSAPFSFVWSDANIGTHQITAIATDNLGTKTTSEEISITVSEERKCEEVSSDATQGSFSQGYNVSFETIGTSVKIQFELLDTDKNGVVAYLWKHTPFTESQMSQESGLVFSSTVGGLTVGETISYACKFAYAGGLSATKYFDYVVGSSCTGSSSDETAPENFTATIGNVTSLTVEILLNATDNAGKVVYDISYGNTTVSVNGDSGVQKSIIINGLNEETSYSFSISAKDLSGNEAINNAINLQATTLKNTNSDCSGTKSDAIEGSFSLGYTYEFITNGTDVTLTFELLDTDKTGVVAYLWQQSPFSETQMSLVSGKKFTKTVGGFTNGQTINYACKFAFAGGLAVTKYLSYTVGDTCVLYVDDNVLSESLKLYPNPVNNVLNIDSKIINLTKVEIFSLIGKKLFESTTSLNQIYIDDLSSGLYLIKVSSEKGKFMKKFIKE